jgi:hypothetical protein
VLRSFVVLCRVPVLAPRRGFTPGHLTSCHEKNVHDYQRAQRRAGRR